MLAAGGAGTELFGEAVTDAPAEAFEAGSIRAGGVEPEGDGAPADEPGIGG